MDISETAAGAVKVVGLAGRLDAVAVEQVRDRLLASADAPATRLVLDLSGLAYVSSAGLRLVLQLTKRVSTCQGRLALCALTRQVQQVFDLAGFAALIQIYGTRDEALAALG